MVQQQHKCCWPHKTDVKILYKIVIANSEHKVKDQLERQTLLHLTIY